MNLTTPYYYAAKKDKSSFILTVLSEAFEKIYFSKTFFFFKKYEVITSLISLYLLYHILVLAFSICFFDIKTIRKIYNEKDYPGWKFYVVNGVYIFLINSVVYSLLLWLIRFDSKVKEFTDVDIMKGKKNEKVYTKSESQAQLSKLISNVRIRVIIFFAVAIILSVLGFIYATGFCAVFISTKKYAFLAYGIALLFNLAAKFVYGLILGIFRFISLKTKTKALYNIVKIFELYVQ